MKTILKLLTWIVGAVGSLGIGLGLAKLGEVLIDKLNKGEDGAFGERHPVLALLVVIVYIALCSIVPVLVFSYPVLWLIEKISKKIDEKFEDHIEMKDEFEQD